MVCIYIVAVLTSIDKCESCHQLNLKKSVLGKVVKVLESPTVQEMELAQQVKKMLLESILSIAGDEATRPHRKRSVLACVLSLCVFVHF